MIKQSNIFTGAELTSVENHELKKEKREKRLEELGIIIVSNTKNKVRKKIENFKYIRTIDGLYELKSMFRHFYVSINIYTQEEKFLCDKDIKDVADSINELLHKKDIIIYKFNERVSVGIIKDIVKVYRQSEKKIIVRDNYDNNIYVISYANVLNIKEISDLND